MRAWAWGFCWIFQAVAGRLRSCGTSPGRICISSGTWCSRRRTCCYPSVKCCFLRTTECRTRSEFQRWIFFFFCPPPKSASLCDLLHPSYRWKPGRDEGMFRVPVHCHLHSSSIIISILEYWFSLDSVIRHHHQDGHGIAALLFAPVHTCPWNWFFFWKFKLSLSMISSSWNHKDFQKCFHKETRFVWVDELEYVSHGGSW